MHCAIARDMYSHYCTNCVTNLTCTSPSATIAYRRPFAFDDRLSLTLSRASSLICPGVRSFSAWGQPCHSPVS